MFLQRYYEQPDVLHVGTESTHAYFIPCSSREQALLLAKNPVRRADSDRFQLLSGDWEFRYFNSPEEVSGDDILPNACWPGSVSMPVPSVWQNHGFDRHQYTNVNYPFPFDPPYVPRENPVGLYRRTFDTADWNGERYLVFEGVDSCFYVWLNGQFVGYSQVSHSTSEFRVTKMLRPGQNVITVAVLKWCDGSYLEDQDKLRMSGIFRDVYLISRPTEHLRDYTIKTPLNPDGSADIIVELDQTSPALQVCGTLLSPCGKELMHLTASGGEMRFHVENPKLWNAEAPVLYTLLLESEGEVIPQRVGIRQVEIRDRVILLNGVKIKFRGVNRHDSDPVTGYAISFEQAQKDLRLMKEHNVNAIRTSHYPNAPWFPLLCCEYGFYMISESDVESHGCTSLYGSSYEDSYSILAWDERFSDAILDRVQRNVLRDKNCACILLWSLGNEAGAGPNFERAAAWVHENDPTHLVHYESSYHIYQGKKMDCSDLDVVSCMYPSVADCRAYPTHDDSTKPLVLCEYIHAMGNGPGGAEEYQELIDQNDWFAGGFVWEWCDHAVLMGKTNEGKDKYYYGGDFGEFPHDGNFCMDGLVYPDRTPHNGLREYKNVIRPARAKWNADGTITISNKLAFLNLKDALTARYEVTQDDVCVASGELPELDAAPWSSITLPLECPIPETGRCFLKITYFQKGNRALTQEGHELGFDQLELRPYNRKVQLPKSGEVQIHDTDWEVILTGVDFRYVFDKRKGVWTSLVQKNHSLLEKPIEYNLWRAPTDNDQYVRKEWENAGYNRELVRTYQTSCRMENGRAVVECDLSLAPIYLQRTMTIHAVYTVGADGMLQTHLEAEKTEGLPDLPRFGVRLFLPKAMDRARYWGYGPYESYADKRSACYWGQFETTAERNHEDYIKPQENGSHFGCDAAEITDASGCGIFVESGSPFCFNISPYTQEELTAKAHNFELEASPWTVVCLDAAQNGIGTNSCGPYTEEPYRLNAQHLTFDFVLRMCGQID